ncbi:amino acid transporter [Acetobacter nitrogenifigens DSM 23921 = NBRC 105050]|uniref:Amino acid permease n=1 Tax=Acetobacter nitrogenifigens DSM 23921 = NBRC 105050 TaxID=1120919 RepID=A0A511XD78_9PROT|nr:amino acid permease [Acetobacter nitrogenifigens]GBQ90080.1 amino acid transporter [Acetobacter nitrogenifigens DSM 23921 = NBRC 105050]GEN60910.1 amino acid permease [Acetobacter nitrogenifigens DSM 23921 = NBRC 105050]
MPSPQPGLRSDGAPASPTDKSFFTRGALRKSVETIERENESHGLRRSLGPVQLTMLGVGSTIGAGIYVMTGTAAANYAGPAILLSFVIAGLACLFTALSYGELASAMPVSGSAYSYAYVSLGERAAWWVGWLLLLEYGISCAGVASGFSGYAVSLLGDLGVHVPAALHTTLIQTTMTPAGMRASVGQHIDLVGAGVVLFVTVFLVMGVEESVRINTAIVILKVGVLLIFMIVGLRAIHPAYWTPFIPPSEGSFHYGIPGIFRAASIIFFAYVGFEAVSTASSEARNPRRDIPIGVIGSLLICTVVYICVAAVLIGVVPWRTLDVADPLALAVDAIGWPWLALLVKVGAVIGLCSVLFGLLYGQSRIFFTIARDGLLPPAFCILHPRFRTPWKGAIILGATVALATAFLPIDIISDLVSIGTASAFGVVCLTVIWDRNARPDAIRPFRVPLGGVRIRGVWIGIAPALGIAFCLIMVGPLFIDVVRDLLAGNPTPAILLTCYFALGAGIYRYYGLKHSHLRASATS